MEDVTPSRADLKFKFEMPFDVKSGRDTGFGKVHTCGRTGLQMVDPLPDLSDIPAHYDLPKYYTHGTRHMPEVTPTIVDRVLTHLAWRVDKGKRFDPAEFKDAGKTVLDIGCGGGNFLTSFSDLGLETFGVEPDENALAQARDKGHRVFAGTAEDIPAELTDRTYDAILMNHVLEHCRDPAKALATARALLSENGVFYCEVPNAGSVYFETYGQISEMLDIPRHLYFFRRQDLERLATQAGLEITEWKSHGLTRHFSAGWKAWENSIFDRLKDAGTPTATGRRSAMGDLKLLAAGLFQPRERRYDCIGFTAKRA